MTTVFDIKKLEVVLYTNDPQNPKIILKGSMFDDVRGEYPLFTDGVLYSESVINELYGDDHSQKIQTFFNENMFQIFLEQCGKAQTQLDDVNIKGCNIKTMLEILFKISYPVPKQVSLVDPNIYSCPSLAVQSIFDEIKKPFIPGIYTHLSLKSKKYTVIDVKWPNTIKTNPDYAMGIIKSLAIYNKEKIIFDELNQNKVEKILERIQERYKSSVTFPSNGFLFKQYTNNNNNNNNNNTTELDKSINTLIDKVNKLYQSFVFYIYLWIARIINKGISTVDTNFLFEQNFKDLISSIKIKPTTIFPAKTSDSNTTPLVDELFKIPSSTIGGIEKKYCEGITDEDRMKLIAELYDDRSLFTTSLNDNTFEKDFKPFLLDFWDKIFLYSKSGKQGAKKSQKGFNTQNRKNFENDKQQYNTIERRKSFFTDLMTDVENMEEYLCDYGFGDDGLYTQIMDIHKTIKTLSEFKIEGIKSLQNAKTQIESLSKIPKSLFDIEKLTLKLQDIKSLYEINEGASIVESSQTKKSPDRERIWYELYRNHRWYRSFSETIRELTQTRRSTNIKINEVLDVKKSVNIEALTNLIEGDTEAGIDEINIGQGSRENLPTFKINLFCILIGGEITDANRRMISCPYKANVLGDLFDNLRFGKSIVFLRTKFIDLSKAIKTAEDKAKQDEAKKNKTRKKQPKNNGIEGLVKQTGLENYNDQGFMENFGQGFGLPNFSGPANNRVKPEKQQQQKPNYNNTISSELETFISTDFKSINTSDATGISNRIRGKTFDDSTRLLDYLKTSIDPSVIKVMETVVSQEDVFYNLEKFEKIKNEIIEYTSKYHTKYQILNSKHIEDDNEKDKHYLEMYHTKIMENLFTELDKELNKQKPIISSSPRGGGGSKKRLLKKSFRKTLRKAYRK
jgi:predicted CopG family antitoxin